MEIGRRLLIAGPGAAAAVSLMDSEARAGALEDFMAQQHKCDMEPRLVTVNDLCAFDPNAVVTLDPFINTIGRRFQTTHRGSGQCQQPRCADAAHHPEARFPL